MSLDKNAEVNFNTLLAPLEKLCAECDNFGQDNCKESTCLVGFSKRTLRFAAKKGLLDIPGAATLIPNNDFKPYYKENVVPVLAETCRQCKDCRENHSPDCVIALIRSAMEHAAMLENISYPGSVFMYLAKIREQNPELASIVATAYKK